MSRVLINGLLADSNFAGIGNYSINMINTIIDANIDHQISVLCQTELRNNHNDVIKRKYANSFQRILAEQIFLRNVYNKFDFVHFLDYSSPILNINIPYLVTIHDLCVYKYPETFTYLSKKTKKLIAPLSIKGAHKIIADSEHTKKDLLEIFNINESKIEVVYPGRPETNRIEDKRQIEIVKRKYNISGEYILYVGTLEPRKNILRLIDAYAYLYNLGIQEKLVLVGKKGWLYQKIFEKVRDLGLEDRVVFTGFIDEKEKPHLYSGAKMFVYPSLYEGFGLPPLEAMTIGTPVITSDSSSLPEVLGDAGLYLNPEDISSFVSTIQLLINNEDLRKDLVAKGMRRSKMFSWQKSAQRILDIYGTIGVNK